MAASDIVQQCMTEMQKNLNGFRHSSLLCDLYLISEEGVSFPAHKLILMSTSSFFQELCGQVEPSCTQEINLPAGSTIISQVLDMMYGNIQEVGDNERGAIRYLAEILHLDYVIQWCDKSKEPECEMLKTTVKIESNENQCNNESNENTRNSDSNENKCNSESNEDKLNSESSEDKLNSESNENGFDNESNDADENDLIRNIQPEIENHTVSNNDTGHTPDNQKNFSVKIEKEIEIKCKHCKETFQTDEQLICHIYSAGHFKCNECDSVFKSKNSFRRHQNYHTDKFKCSQCNKKFGNAPGLIRHKLTHSGLRPYVCDFCNVAFGDMSTLAKHKKTKHLEVKTEKWRVKEVPKEISQTLDKFNITESFVELTPIGVKEAAKYVSPNKGDLVHSKTVETETSYSCEICKRKFKLHGSYIVHMEVHKEDPGLLNTTNLENKDVKEEKEKKKRSRKLKVPLKVKMIKSLDRNSKMKCTCGELFPSAGLRRKHALETHGGFPCTGCDIKFDNFSKLKRHFLVHDKNHVRLKCRLCPATFKERDTKLKHERIHVARLAIEKEMKGEEANISQQAEQLIAELKPLYRYTCTVCDKGHVSFTEYIDHLTTHTTPNNAEDQPTPNESTSSGSKSTEQSALLVEGQESIQAAIEKDNHKCLECDKFFPNKWKLKRHTQVHTGLRPFKCQYCLKGFSENRYRMKHEAQHFKDIRVECPICKKKLAERGLKNHMDKHKGTPRFKCEECDKMFYTDGARKTHLFRTHEIGSEERKQKLMCDHCDKLFYTTTSLEAHKNKIRGYLPYICQYCSKSFPLKKSVDYHILQMHLPKRYPCDQCDKSFLFPKALADHKLKHSGKKSYKCKICSKSYVSEHRLTRHTASIHPDAKPYGCEHCSELFLAEYQLRNHIRATHREKPYKCVHCSESFIRHTTLVNHELSHDGVTVHSCQECGGENTDSSETIVAVTVHEQLNSEPIDIGTGNLHDEPSVEEHPTYEIVVPMEKEDLLEGSETFTGFQSASDGAI